ncbi:uncharacterized protein ACBR49_008487 [Aulostomus maculatus]
MARLCPAAVALLLLTVLALLLCMESRVHQSNALRRRKREWILPPIKLTENKDYTKREFIAKIRSDKEKDAKVEYYISGPGADRPPLGLFLVNHDSGFVRITGIVDREKYPSYNLTGIARYRNGSTAEANIPLTITILDENDNSPYFGGQTGSIAEGSKDGTFVMQIMGKDDDQAGTPHSEIAYSIVSQEPVGTGQMFTIDSKTGKLYVKEATLDRETTDFYKLVIKGADMGGAQGAREGTGTVEINVMDINDNIPTLEKSEYSGSVAENVADVVVMRIKALDRDLEPTDNWLAVFSIAKGNEDNLFSIETDKETNEGILKLIKPVDFEEVQNLELGLLIENVAPFVEGSAVVTDVDIHVGEGDASAPGSGAGLDGGMDVAVISGGDVIIDADAGGTMDAGGFRPGAGSGSGTHASLQPGAPAKSYIIKVAVNNVPEDPEFKPDTKNIPVSEDPNEMVEDGVIAVFTAVDPDTGSPAEDVSYAKAHDPDNWFTIDEETAEIKLNKVPDRESPFLVNGTYIAKILAITKDMPSKTATGTIAIQVADSNDHCPTLTTTYNSLCSDEKTVFVTGVDEDQGQNGAPFTFRIISDGTRGNWDVEGINGTTAALKSREALWPGSYKLQVEVSDAQGLSCPANEIFTVDVCTCEEQRDCGIRTARVGTTSTEISTSAIALLLMGMCLLLLIPLLLIFCQCGGANAIFADKFSDIPFEAKEHLISYHTEGKGEDKELPVQSVPVTLGTQKKVENAQALKFNATPANITKSYQKAAVYKESVQKSLEENSQNFMEVDSHDRSTRAALNYGKQIKTALYEDIALPDAFLDDYYSQKAAYIAPVKNSLLMFNDEGQGSSAGSVGCCSLLDSDYDLQFLNDLGPKFKTLADLCSPPTMPASPQNEAGVVKTAVDIAEPIKPKVEQLVESTHSDIKESVSQSSNISHSATLPFQAQTTGLQQQPVYYTTSPVLQPMHCLLQPQLQNTLLVADGAHPANFPGLYVVSGPQNPPSRLVVSEPQGLPSAFVVRGLQSPPSGLVVSRPLGLPTGPIVGGLQSPTTGLVFGGLLSPPSGLVVSGGQTPPTGLVVEGLQSPPSGLVVSGHQSPPSGLIVRGFQNLPSGLVVSGSQSPPSGLVVRGLQSPPSGPIVSRPHSSTSSLEMQGSPTSLTSQVSPSSPVPLLSRSPDVLRGSAPVEDWKMIGPNPVGTHGLSGPSEADRRDPSSSQGTLPRGADLVKEAAPPQGVLGPAAHSSVTGILPGHSVAKNGGVVQINENTGQTWAGHTRLIGLESGGLWGNDVGQVKPLQGILSVEQTADVSSIQKSCRQKIETAADSNAVANESNPPSKEEMEHQLEEVSNPAQVLNDGQAEENQSEEIIMVPSGEETTVSDHDPSVVVEAVFKDNEIRGANDNGQPVPSEAVEENLADTIDETVANRMNETTEAPANTFTEIFPQENAEEHDVDQSEQDTLVPTEGFSEDALSAVAQMPTTEAFQPVTDIADSAIPDKEKEEISIFEGPLEKISEPLDLDGIVNTMEGELLQTPPNENSPDSVNDSRESCGEDEDDAQQTISSVSRVDQDHANSDAESLSDVERVENIVEEDLDEHIKKQDALDTSTQLEDKFISAVNMNDEEKMNDTVDKTQPSVERNFSLSAHQEDEIEIEDPSGTSSNSGDQLISDTNIGEQEDDLVEELESPTHHRANISDDEDVGGDSPSVSSGLEDQLVSDDNDDRTEDNVGEMMSTIQKNPSLSNYQNDEIVAECTISQVDNQFISKEGLYVAEEEHTLKNVSPMQQTTSVSDEDEEIEKEDASSTDSEIEAGFIENDIIVEERAKEDSSPKQQEFHNLDDQNKQSEEKPVSGLRCQLKDQPAASDNMQDREMERENVSVIHPKMMVSDDQKEGSVKVNTSGSSSQTEEEIDIRSYQLVENCQFVVPEYESEGVALTNMTEAEELLCEDSTYQVRQCVDASELSDPAQDIAERQDTAGRDFEELTDMGTSSEELRTFRVATGQVCTASEYKGAGGSMLAYGRATEGERIHFDHQNTGVTKPEQDEDESVDFALQTGQVDLEIGVGSDESAATASGQVSPASYLGNEVLDKTTSSVLETDSDSVSAEAAGFLVQDESVYVTGGEEVDPKTVTRAGLVNVVTQLPDPDYVQEAEARGGLETPVQLQRVTSQTPQKKSTKSKKGPQSPSVKCKQQ